MLVLPVLWFCLKTTTDAIFESSVVIKEVCYEWIVNSLTQKQRFHFGAQ